VPPAKPSYHCRVGSPPARDVIPDSHVAVFGAAGLAIALAFQGTISNFASGVMLLIFRPFSLGDFVDVGGTAGTVSQIDVFTTTITTPDNVKIIVPNGAIFGQTIKNFSANETRRIDLVIGVGYGDDLGRSMEVITRTVMSDERVLKDPAFVIAVSELADSSVNFVVRPWCGAEDYWDLRWDLTRNIKEALDENGISIPFPQRDIHMIQAG
jgi:small conductance mechanosensitive channel